MKNITLLLLLFAGMANAQSIVFADANFKNAILNSRFPEVIDTNENGEIEFAETAVATMLDVSNFDISSMAEIQYFTALRTLHCYNNNLTALDLSPLAALQDLNCNQNALTSLLLNHTISTYIGIQCSENQLTTLDLHNLKLETLHCNDNLLASVNLSGITAMYEGDFRNNQLIAIEFPEYPIESGDFLAISNNPLTSFTVRHASLINFNCSDTPITTLDVSYSTFNRTGVYLSNNPNLQYINIKNGGLDVCDPTDSSCGRSWEITDCPALRFVCVDDFAEAQAIQERASNLPVCSPYCSFVPGGNYNTITGQIRFDIGNDGCTNDLPLALCKVGT